MRFKILFSFLFIVSFCIGQTLEKNETTSRFFEIDSCYKEGRIYEDTFALSPCLGALANKYAIDFDLLRFKEVIERSQKLFEQDKFKNKRALFKLNEGDFYVRMGVYGKSLQSYQEANEVIEGLEINTRINILNRIGIVYGLTSNFKKSKDKFDESLMLLGKTTDSNVAFQCYNNIGAHYLNVEEYNLAAGYFKKASKYSTMENNSVLVLYNLATIFHKKNEYFLANAYVKKALEKSQTNSSKLIRGYVYNLAGHLESEFENYNQAKKHFFNSLTLAKLLKSKELKQKNFKSLSVIFNKEGNFKRAFDYLGKYVLLKDSGKSEEINLKAKGLIAKYELKKLLKENNNNKEKVEVAKSDLKFKERKISLLIFIIVSILLIVLILGLVLRYKNKLKVYQMLLTNEKLAHEKDKIFQANKKIEFLKESIIDKNRIIRNSDKKNLSVESKKKLIKRLSNEKNWAKFMIEFRLLHETFFEQLKIKYPRLTNKDLRLCALIKLNLLDKELADLLSIELESVKKSKSRLKSKLELDDNQSLTSFFNF